GAPARSDRVAAGGGRGGEGAGGVAGQTANRRGSCACASVCGGAGREKWRSGGVAEWQSERGERRIAFSGVGAGGERRAYIVVRATVMDGADADRRDDR